MKRFTAFALVMVSVFLLIGCGYNSQKAVAAVISEKVTKIDITHRNGADARTWMVEGDEIALLREWLGKIDYKHLAETEGPSLEKHAYIGMYTFVLTGGEWPGFSYVIVGPDDCYIQSEGNWFSVTNPTDPPVPIPVE